MKVETHKFFREIDDRIQAQPSGFVFAAFSAPVEALAEIKRVRIRPLLIKQELYFQISSFTKTQSFSVNVGPLELAPMLTKAAGTFSQAVIRFVGDELHAHIEGDKTSYKTTEHKKIYIQDLAHNRLKNYQLPEKAPSKVLIALGVQSKEGKVLSDKYDKFKQINRFLEIVGDIQDELSDNPTILDFGCGKAYLTFALHSMLEHANIIGIDSRKDVIDKCIALKESINAQNLDFKRMRIEDFTQEGPVDLVLALHACDTATDAALAQAIKVQARVILVAPCCQHEVASQIKKEKFPLLLQHGILKERFSALLTDALRAEILNQLGYSVDLIEFIDPEHTPKNLLIRAKRKKNPPKPDWKAYKELTESLGVTITLEKLLQLS